MIEIIGTDLNQWDVDRSVKVTDVGATHVHFANTGDSKAVIMDAAGPEVMIPNFLLQTGKQLCVYAVENGVTVERKTFSVRKRERPENYVYEDDQRNYFHALIKAAEDIIASNAEKTTPDGGVIFGGDGTNEASAQGAISIGPGSKANAEGAIAAGDSIFRSGAEYVKNTAGQYYVESADCELTMDADVVAVGYEVISLDELNNGTDIYVKTADGGYALKADLRYNEAVGSGSTANGMGDVAFARASKSLGYRTQTGYPPSEDWFDKRPELLPNGVELGDLDHVQRGGGIFAPDLCKIAVLSPTIRFTYSATQVGDNGKPKIRFQFLNASGASLGSETVTVVANDEKQLVTIDAIKNAATVRIHGYFAQDGDAWEVHLKNMKLFFIAEENIGQAAVALGADTAALEHHSIAGGWRAIARAKNAVAIGSAETDTEEPTEASAYGAIAIGRRNKSSAKNAVTFGRDNTSSAECAFSVGVGNVSSSYTAFTSGEKNIASAYNAMTGGSGNIVSHANAVAIGRALKTGKGNQAVFGQYNEVVTDALTVIGKGTSDTARSNAFVVKSNGNVLAGGATVHSGADYAEFFEWMDGNPDAEDRIGLLVSLVGEKICFAMPGDDVIGVVSGTAAVLGDAAAMHWKDKYLTDEFGRTIYDMVEGFIEVPDPETGELVKESTGLMPQPRLNPDYDPEMIYIPREERPEWDKIGMIGKIYTRDDGTCAAGDYGCPGENGVLTKSNSKTNIRVMKRISDNIVLVLLK